MKGNTTHQILRRFVPLAVALMCACGSGQKAADDQPTETKVQKLTFEQKLEAARDRAQAAIVHIEGDLERATSTKPLAAESDDDHKVGVADLKSKLDQLGNDINGIFADTKTEEQLEKAEETIEERLDELGKESKDLLDGDDAPAEPEAESEGAESAE